MNVSRGNFTHFQSPFVRGFVAARDEVPADVPHAAFRVGRRGNSRKQKMRRTSLSRLNQIAIADARKFLARPAC